MQCKDNGKKPRSEKNEKPSPNARLERIAIFETNRNFARLLRSPNAKNTETMERDVYTSGPATTVEHV